MRAALLVVFLAAVIASQSVRAQPQGQAHETRVPVGDVSLYARAIGQGRPAIVLHGGPDFDHAYLLPDLDRLMDIFQLIYYDQRGRGRSAENVQPQNVTLASDIQDIDSVRRHFALNAPVLFGHSWGTVLAVEYALRHPTHVSHLVLMNPAPVSARDFALLREAYLRKIGASMDRQREILASAEYKNGDPEAVAARYRIHFTPALRRPEDFERLMTIMKAQFVNQGSAGIIKARAVEDQLMRDTWQNPNYDLLPKLRALPIPTLVVTGDHDFIPVDISEHIARAVPNAKLVTIKDCGHFAYLECRDAVRHALEEFFRSAK
ncbi:proline iminopeptidase [Steroidobacter agaridevorans]|uniref:Proline iminopeptidase n=1 Tax=Steroidobacter agaridevorans TaxID=2695856 RepID=A0A829Y8A4_9GAMM|nr:alpha/beta fold hydrolase [Steroidobacter agaridevorans]GFE79514.1 proline iminopeptidase [Steroidobacter agaridevorans]GFE88519.1 proline iminopeptidase [Steroidobacter agaridevorans]